MSRIALEDLFRRVIDVVEAQRIPFLVYGGLALPAWGQVVTTRDVDLVVRVDEPGAERLVQALRAAGFHVPANAETLFFIDTWMVASMGGREVDFALGVTEFDESALSRAVRVQVFGRKVPLATAEDLILYKLAAYRTKDLAHVEDIVLRQGDKLDRGYLRRWAHRIAEATGKFEVPRKLEELLSARG